MVKPTNCPKNPKADRIQAMADAMDDVIAATGCVTEADLRSRGFTFSECQDFGDAAARRAKTLRVPAERAA
jgi:hypothetical protein